MEQVIFDVDSLQATLYNISRECPSSWRELQVYSKNAELNIPYYFKLTVKKILNIPTLNFYKLKNDLSSDSFKNHILPMAVRYISKENIYVIERPPFQLEVDFRLGGAHSQNSMMPPVKIWVPWTIMIFNANSVTNGDFSEIRLFFNSGPLESMDQPIIPCFYPNTHHDARICFASSLNDFNNVLDTSQISEGNIGYIYNYLFNNYMMGGWNSDLVQNVFRTFYQNDRKTIADKYPMINLFLNPNSDKQFYEKLSTVFPKKFFTKIKKYYLNKFNLNNISREKYYSINFGILATFTLEQSINFVKEAQSVFGLHENRLNTVSKVIKEYKSPTSTSSGSNTGISLVTQIINPSVQYDYKQCIVDFFVINNTEQQIRMFGNNLLEIPSKQMSAINCVLINFLNTKEENEHIAFIYDYSLKTFDILINYDAETYITNIVNTSVEAIRLLVAKDPNVSYRIKNYIDLVDQHSQSYRSQFVNS